jgi:hypothetical protein
MFAVLTIAIGMVTLQTQSDFWFGVFVTIASVWGVDAIARVAASRRPSDRAGAIAFLCSAALCVNYGFGPWSDAGMRGTFPDSAIDLRIYCSNAQFATLDFVRLSLYLKPRWRGVIRSYDDDGHLKARIEVTAPREHRSDADTVFRNIKVSIDRRFDVIDQPTLGKGYVVVDDSLDVYMNGCYLLSSLFVAWLAGAVVSLAYALKVRAGGPPFTDRAVLDKRHGVRGSRPSKPAAPGVSSCGASRV